MRLIDADALLEELKKTYKYFDLKFYIDQAPTIDVNKVQTTAEPNIDNGEVSVSDMAGDLISRQDAIEAVVCHIWHTPADERKLFNWENYVRSVVEDAINRLPSAEPAPVVAYICDRRRCAICNAHDGTCRHTTDIKHAAHFKNVAGQYFERPYMEEEDDGNL